MVVTNLWGISRDLQHFPDPEEFRPERWQTKTKDEVDACNPSEYAFGFGRRQCPGKKFADTSLFLVIATIVATMNISKALDEHGNEITPPHAYTSGFSNCLKPFQCKIEPRSERIAEMIENFHVDGF